MLQNLIDYIIEFYALHNRKIIFISMSQVLLTKFVDEVEVEFWPRNSSYIGGNVYYKGTMVKD